jgi:hypothetical protein
MGYIVAEAEAAAYKAYRVVALARNGLSIFELRGAVAVLVAGASNLHGQ